MKIKHDFVTNSSSSSFIILKENLSAVQIDKIKNHIQVGKRFKMDCCENRDTWNIREFEELIIGDAFMDNFDMRYFLEKIGVDMEQVEWRD